MPSGSSDGAKSPASSSDLESLCALAETWRPYLKAVAAEVLGRQLAGKVDASDVVQGALLASVRSLSQFEGKSVPELQGWLVSIVRNEALQTRRHWRRWCRSPDNEISLNKESGTQRAVADDHPTPSGQFERRERAAQLLQALGRLRADDR